MGSMTSEATSLDMASHAADGASTITPEPRLRRRIAVIAGVIVYVLVFVLVYATVVARIYFSQRYTFHPPPPLAFTISVAMILLSTVFMPVKIEYPSQLLLWLLFVLAVIPSLIVPYLVLDHLTVSTRPLLSFGAVMTSTIIIWCFSYSTEVRFNASPVASYVFWGFLTLFSVVALVATGAKYGLHSPANLADAELVRKDYFAVSAQGNAQVAYLVTWLSNVAAATFIAYGWLRRRYLSFAFGLLAQVFVYSFTGFKSVLFSSVYIAAVALLLRAHERRAFGPRLCFGSLITFGIAIGADNLTGSILPTAIFIRRTFVSPGLFSGIYVDYFSSHPKAVLAHSVLRSFVQNRYPTGPAGVIGTTYYPGTGASANANIWADGYANFGLGGVFSFAVILIVLMRVYDGLTRSQDLRFASVLLAVPGLSLANTGVLTTFSTHGLGFLLFVVAIMPAGLASKQSVIANSGGSRR